MMKFHTPHTLVALTLGVLFAASVPAQPGGYNPAIVAADARWIVHADLNSLRSSQLGKELISTLEKAQTDATEGLVGINIPKLLATVGTLTAYGSNLSADAAALDGTLIAQGTADLRKIVESILLQGTLGKPEVFSEVADLPFPAYAIAEPNAPAGQGTKLVIAFPPEPIVLVSKSKAQLIKARDVFRGAAPSLAKVRAPLQKFASTADGAYLFAAMIVPSEPLFPEKAPQTRMLQLASSGALALGERGSDTFAQAELVASSERNADKLAKIIEGMMALLSLSETSDRQLAEFLQATAITRDKDFVRLRLAYPTARLLQMVQTLRTQIEAQPVARTAPITRGKVIAEWSASESAPDAAAAPGALTWRTIQSVELRNGSMINFGRAMNDGRNARVERVEIIPAGGGAPLVYQREFMRARGSMMQFPFPGSDGTYTLRVGYLNDPEGKATFAVSIEEPRPPQPRTK
jgi:hypothetical protein